MVPDASTAAPLDADAAVPASLPLQRLRAAAIAAVLALVALSLAWELWLAPTGAGTLAIKALPLALALPGLARHRLYTYRWLSLLVWLYVLEGLLRATTEGGIVVALATLEVALSIALFAAMAVYIRRRLRGVKAAAADLADRAATP